MKKTLFGLTIVTIILSCLLTRATAEDISQAVNKVIEKTYNVNPGGRLAINADIGSIDIQTHTQDSVKIVITKKSKKPSNKRLQKVLADFKVTFDVTGSDVSITGAFQRGKTYWRWHPLFNLRHLDTHFLVTVPQRYNVDLNTQSGNISTGGLTGAVQAQTGEGNMRFNGIKGPVSGKSGAGNITLANCQGMVDVKTSVGNIHAEVPTQPQHQWTLQTSTGTGNITAALNSNIAVDIDARISVGHLSTDFRVQGNVTRSRLLGTINGGGPLLKFHTPVGNIALLKN